MDVSKKEGFDPFNEYKTYQTDLPLFEKLGLTPFRGKIREELFVGKVETENGYVSIWVYGCPALFFRFEIYCKSRNKKFLVKTGSGSFEDYWPVAESVMQGLIEVEDISSADGIPINSELQRGTLPDGHYELTDFSGNKMLAVNRNDVFHVQFLDDQGDFHVANYHASEIVGKFAFYKTIPMVQEKS